MRYTQEEASNELQRRCNGLNNSKHVMEVALQMQKEIYDDFKQHKLRDRDRGIGVSFVGHPMIEESLHASIIAHLGWDTVITMCSDKKGIDASHYECFFPELHLGQMHEGREVKPKMEEMLQFEIMCQEKYNMSELRYSEPKKFHQKLNDKHRKRYSRK